MGVCLGLLLNTCPSLELRPPSCLPSKYKPTVKRTTADYAFFPQLMMAMGVLTRPRGRQANDGQRDHLQDRQAYKQINQGAERQKDIYKNTQEENENEGAC